MPRLLKGKDIGFSRKVMVVKGGRARQKDCRHLDGMENVFFIIKKGTRMIILKINGDILMPEKRPLRNFLSICKMLARKVTFSPRNIFCCLFMSQV